MQGSPRASAGTPAPTDSSSVAAGVGVRPVPDTVPPAPARHFAHIDGLRALAVGAVVAYHAGVPFVSGGFVGVDVFFVISGFLITGLLLREVETTGRVDLPRFYARRARRLLPAAALVVLVVAGLGALLLPPISRGTLAVDVVAATLFVANWRYVAAATDYSAAAAEQSPLLHFWSLAVEEQYYLLWPLMLLGAAVAAAALTRRGRRVPARVAVGTVLAVVLVVSLWLSVTLTGSTGTTAYFGLHTRAWELATGGLVAVLLPQLARTGPRLRAAAVVLGLAAVAVSVLTFDAGTPFPGSAALLPVLGTAAVIVGGAGGTLGVTGWLESRPAATLGLLSYSWYLWHWPVLFFAGVVLGDPELAAQGRDWGLTWPLTLAAVLLSLGLAALSYHLVEQPLRFARPLVARSSLSLTLGLVLVCTGLASGAALRAAVPQDQAVVAGATDGRVVTVSQAAGDAMDPGSCHLPQSGPPDLSAECVFGDPDGDLRVLLVGDSHAEHWLPAFDEAGAELGWRVELRSRSACAFNDVQSWLGSERREYVECDEWRDAVLAHAEEQGGYDLTVLVRSTGQVEAVMLDDERVEGEAAGRAWEAATLRSIRSLREVSEQVVVLGTTPGPLTSVPECLSANDGVAAECSFDPAVRVADGAVLTAAEQRVVETLDDPAVRQVPVADLVCPDTPCQVATDEGVVLFRDGSHLTETFARSIGLPLAERLTG
ncbi:acyltransferase family protein [Jannaschia sp. R86511]|uniref:acyltransferase family protein n=1 Tax=Jannaschia sp. R86511 TaxID=3093853 RepID=UPI0036D355A1